MDKFLTDRAFWKSFWESKKDVIFQIKPNYIFGDILGKIITKHDTKSAIELGGFPGYYSVYLKKYQKLDTTLFDYYIHKEIINKLLEKHGLEPGDIKIIEADLFNYTPRVLYDMVLSFGLIEHFIDTKDIIERHLQFLKPGGVLFITLPNFHSVNGWVQRKFDKENYDKHYINCMDPQLLMEICKYLGLKKIRCYYHGKFSTWLENRDQKSKLVRAFVKTIWFTGKVITKVIPIESRRLSPYIVLKAEK